MNNPTPTHDRYPTADGYMRIKAPGHPLCTDRDYVLEHRLVAWEHYGPFDPSMHVHHVNRNKLDNRPENLMVLTASEHAAIHRYDRFDIELAKRMYAEGQSTTAIAKRLGVGDAGNVSRHLRAAGVKMRTPAEGRFYATRDPDDVRAAAADSTSAREIAEKLGVSEMTARRLMRESGVPSFPAGRPRSRT